VLAGLTRQCVHGEEEKNRALRPPTEPALCVSKGSGQVLSSHRYTSYEIASIAVFQISVRQSGHRQRSAWLCLGLTPPAPGGGFAQKFNIERKINNFRALKMQ
jgi:hypothetical protein